MLDPGNLGTITGRLVADPEILKEKVVRFSIARDYAGKNASDKEDRTGFFDFVFFLNDDPNSKFVKSQIDAGNFQKGSGITVAYGLEHQRWQQDDGSKRSKVGLVAHIITYAMSNKSGGESSGERSSSAGSKEAPGEF